MTDTVVVKVGGSLLDLPELGPRLRRWLDTLDAQHILLVPGGGSSADVIRNLDRIHRLGEEAAHWLALRALSLNAAVLLALLPETNVLDTWKPGVKLSRLPRVAIVDPFAFAQADEERSDHLPHRWEVTSDSISVRIAIVVEAGRLILLKSMTIPDAMSWTEAARLGYMDPFFAEVCAPAGPKLRVTTINFRQAFP